MFSKGIQYMLAGTLAFAMMQLSVKQLKGLPIHEIVLFRSIISIVLSLSWIWYKNIRPIMGHNHKVLLLRGIFGTTALFLFFNTLTNIPLATAVTLQYLSPIFTAIFAVFILQESLTLKSAMFFLLSFAGVLIIQGFDQELSWFWLVVGVISSMFAGLAYNCMGVMTLFNFVMPQLDQWIWILIMGLFTQAGQVFMTLSFQAEKAGVVSVLKYLGVLYAVGFDYFLFNHSYSPWVFVGMLLVVLGVVANVRLKPA
jgi:drug/metabolite transporter (DMT)-like permease